MSSRRARAVGVTGLVVALGMLAVVVYWMATGGRWYVVRTPSMGTAAPVGTLLWVHPVDAHHLHVGEFITFTPPGSATTYSHRVYAIHADGTISTKGQITSPDPWRLHPSDVVGTVSMRWWGVGWLIRALPYLVIGALIVWLLIRLVVRERWRLPAAVVGAAVVLCVAIVVLQPFTRADRLAGTQVSGGGRATYVSTGLLPVRLSADGGGHVDLRAGEVGSVVSRHATRPGSYPVHLSPHVGFWWWFWLVVVCFLPALWTVFFGHRRDHEPAHAAAA